MDSTVSSDDLSATACPSKPYLLDKEIDLCKNKYELCERENQVS